MRACLSCGLPLPRRIERGHREREYCSDTCRQRASRERNKMKHDLAHLWQLTQERMANQIVQAVQHETWPEERHLLQTTLNLAKQQQALLEHENALLRIQLDALEEDRQRMQAQITLLREVITHQTEELTRANYLLDHPARKQ